MFSEIKEIKGIYLSRFLKYEIDFIVVRYCTTKKLLLNIF